MTRIITILSFCVLLTGCIKLWSDKNGEMPWNTDGGAAAAAANLTNTAPAKVNKATPLMPKAMIAQSKGGHSSKPTTNGCCEVVNNGVTNQVCPTPFQVLITNRLIYIASNPSNHWYSVLKAHSLYGPWTFYKGYNDTNDTSIVFTNDYAQCFYKVVANGPLM